MKKLFVFIFALAILTGCRDTEIIKNNFDESGTKLRSQEIARETLPTTLKVVKAEEEVWCLATSFFDFTTGSPSPYLKIGIFRIRYNSFPVVPGQPIAVLDEEYSSSWWNWASVVSKTPEQKNNMLRRTIIYIGPVPAGAKVMKLQTGNGVGIILGPNGVSIPNDTKVEFE